MGQLIQSKRFNREQSTLHKTKTFFFCFYVEHFVSYWLCLFPFFVFETDQNKQEQEGEEGTGNGGGESEGGRERERRREREREKKRKLLKTVQGKMD